MAVGERRELGYDRRHKGGWVQVKAARCVKAGAPAARCGGEWRPPGAAVMAHDATAGSGEAAWW